eukprot:11163092-Lingulodinium_polyedra.AAC.1
MATAVPEDQAGICMIHAAGGGSFLVHTGTGEVLASPVLLKLAMEGENMYVHKPGSGSQSKYVRRLLTWRLMQTADGRKLSMKSSYECL